MNYIAGYFLIRFKNEGIAFNLFEKVMKKYFSNYLS